MNKIKNKKIIFSTFISIIFASTLLLIRVVYTGNYYYLFLLWNIFLAIIPLLVILFIDQYRDKLSIIIKLPLLIVWILFLPNTFYIVTDLIHLKVRNDIGLWFDLILVSSFVFSGVLIGLFSLRLFGKFLRRSKFRRLRYVVLVFVIYIISFGIYLGRFLRWNSWDILTSANELFSDIVNKLVNPLANIQAYLFSFIFGSFILILYLIFELFLSKKE